MNTYEVREFRRLGFRVIFRLMKFHGHLVWLMEKVQFNRELEGVDVDCLYDRYYALQDAIDAFRRSRIWRSVDVVDDGHSDEM